MRRGSAKSCGSRCLSQAAGDSGNEAALRGAKVHEVQDVNRRERETQEKGTRDARGVV